MLDNEELWRQIPPEEKLELMSKAQAKGVSAAATLILISGTLAVGFQQTIIFWAGLLTSPIVFQFVSGRAWRALRPRAMLEYLGARSAARRYAFTAQAQDLHLNLLFRGRAEKVFAEEQVLSALDAAITGNKDSSVWVALFNDAVVLLSERAGGASCEFAQVINPTLEIDVTSPDKREYSRDKQITLTCDDKKHGRRSIRISSQQAAALVVFEKKLTKLIEDKKLAAKPAVIPEVIEEFKEILP
jgi:hypothetical protein